jgi:RNA polymerase sigma-70 factor (ECF subfamily)
MTTGSRAELVPVESLAGNEAVLDRFVREHYPRLVRLAGLVCQRPSDAEDAVQAGLERAWRNRTSLRDQDRLRPWLDRIVVREALRTASRRGRGLSLLGGVTIGEIDLEDRRGEGGTDWTALRIEFERLTPDHRAVIALHLYAGYTVDQTAHILGVPGETVRSRLRVAKDLLRARLGDPRP